MRRRIIIEAFDADDGPSYDVGRADEDGHEFDGREDTSLVSHDEVLDRVRGLLEEMDRE